MHIRLSSPLLPNLFRLIDLLTIAFAAWCAALIKQLVQGPMIVGSAEPYYLLIIAGSLLYLALNAKSYSNWRSNTSIISALKGSYLAWVMTIGAMLIILYLSKSGADVSRAWFLIWIILGQFLLLLVRVMTYLLLGLLRSLRYNQRGVIIIGAGRVANDLASRIQKNNWFGYYLLQHIPVVRKEELERLEQVGADEVWLALPIHEHEQIEEALFALRHSASSIRYIPDLFTTRLINHEATEIANTLMFNLSATPITGLNQIVKWLEDKVISMLILILVSPIMLLVAIGIKLTSPGPVLYKQERVGLNNKRFMMLKFRSMPVDTESATVRWGSADSKVKTKFGQFIRKTNLDELPQFINVLRGDMSIVGPRPERSVFVEEFKEKIPLYMKKHLVKAGITGWAQVNGYRGDTDLKQRIEHDIHYIENWSLALDFKIIFLTILTILIDKHVD